MDDVVLFGHCGFNALYGMLVGLLIPAMFRAAIRAIIPKLFEWLLQVV